MSRKTRESTVVSARLYKDDKDEGRALAVLHKWHKSGLNTSQIICRSLLALDELPMPEADNLSQKLRDVLAEAIQLVANLRRGEIVMTDADPGQGMDTDAINEVLVASLKARAGKGKRVEE